MPLTLAEAVGVGYEFPVVTVNYILGLSLGLIFFVLFDLLFYRIFKSKSALVYAIVAQVIFLCSYGLGISVMTYISFGALCVGMMIYFFANLSNARLFFMQITKSKVGSFLGRGKAKGKPEVIFGREAMYAKIETAVLTMSKQKIGALITFEKKDSLTQVMKSGTAIEAPVTSELLQTIFYPGTRLHDGAVIIRDDKIAAASVYFTPTTRPLTGKFGSRHRAAIGISEVSDSVTVVVSEETGRISIAYDGELQSVSGDIFLKTLEEYMALNKEEEEKAEKEN